MNIISKTNLVEVQIVENPYNLRIPGSPLVIYLEYHSLFTCV